MGLFSNIWKGVKNVFGGIMKIFAPILKPLGKILNTGWGKAIMLAMSVFTMGASLLAGGQTFMQTAGSFLDKFIAGGKEFLVQALGIKPKAETVAGGATAPGVQAGSGGAAADLAAGQAVNPGELLGANIPGGDAVSQAGSMAMGPGPTGDTMMGVTQAAGPGAGSGAIPGMTSAPTPPPGTPTSGLGAGEAMKPGFQLPGSQVQQPSVLKTGQVGGVQLGQAAEGGNWLSKAANKAWEFANSELGGELIGGAMEGYQQGKRDEAYYAEQRRIDDMWRNPNDPGMLGISSARERSARYSPPRGMAGAPALYANRISQGGIENYAPSVPFI